MALNLLKKRNIKIAAATSLVVFSLLVTFSSAIAWFISIRSVKNSTTSFGVTYDDSTITASSVYCVKYDGIYGGTATKLTDENHTLTMSEYDYIFRDRNVNTPLFLRIVIEGFDNSKNLSVVIPCTGTYKSGSNKYIDNYLSNVVWAKFSYGLETGSGVVKDTYTLEGNTINGGDAETIYEGMRDRASSLTGTPFVTNTATGEKDSTISITIPKNTIPNSFVTDGVVVVYLEFDYYATSSVNLVENYIESYSEEGVTEEPNPSFISDIGIVTLRDSD